MAYINAKEVYNKYVEDVINRNKSALEFQTQSKAFSDKLPLKSIKKFVEDFYKQERAEFGEPKIKTEDNDFETFEKNTRINIIIDNFGSRPETLAVKSKMIEARENKDDKALEQIVDKLYSTFSTEISEKKLEEKVWKNKLIYKTTEIANRKLIGKDFEAEFAPEKDRGNCTKGITVSIYRASEDVGLTIYQTNQDKENAAHPKTLAQELDTYTKSAESGLLKDIENIKVGDIVLISNHKGEPRHAMMVSSFNEQGDPLLVGFTPTQKDVPMLANKQGEFRKGIIIDVKSFISDKVAEHNRAEISHIMSVQKKSQTH